ncbi:MAG: hypothetical protein LBL62_08450 [Planctomycetaceae bacterium]|jgi:hypothetical protein|nr:hypothetical protein [Planctomycetaceae bacterium]
MRFLPIILLLIGLLFTLSGCADRPEVSPQTYGTILNDLPKLTDAETPFSFPYAGENDHRNCEFKEEDFF